jgi:two-component system, probable response regulator PhcQ
MNAPDYSAQTILYVDDELQSLKYFPKLFPEFRIVTADGVKSAREYIKEHGDSIAVVISDQRMPDGSGTELLSELNRTRPAIVRMLTTAYSDLDSAIAAVNSGAVYRYVVKPWDQADLRQTLMRAYDLFMLQRERDRLVREKVSVLQRIVLMDRIRSFAVLAAGLANRIKHPIEALKAFLDAAPPPGDGQSRSGEVQWSQLWEMAQHESRRILETVDGVVRRTVEPDFQFAAVDLASLVHDTLATVTNEMRAHGITLTVEVDPSVTGTISGNEHMLRQMIRILPERLALVDPEAKRILVRCTKDEVWGQAGVRISVIAEGRDWTTAELHTCFSMLSNYAFMPNSSVGEGDLLAAYFIAYHHAGTMSVHRASPLGPGFAAVLPVDPEAASIPGVDPQWIERTLTWFDG